MVCPSGSLISFEAHVLGKYVKISSQQQVNCFEAFVLVQYEPGINPTDVSLCSTNHAHALACALDWDL
jgi:hypothetical protein